MRNRSYRLLTSPNTVPTTQHKYFFDLHCLSPKINLMIDLPPIGNVIENVWNNNLHPPIPPNTPSAIHNEHLTSDRNFLKTTETSFPMRCGSDHTVESLKTKLVQGTWFLGSPIQSRFWWILEFSVRLVMESGANLKEKFHRRQDQIVSGVPRCFCKDGKLNAKERRFFVLLFWSVLEWCLVIFVQHQRW